MLNIRSFNLGPLQTNAYLLTGADPTKGIIIDPGMNPAALVRSIEGMEIEAILLTHAHFDHMGGVDEIRKAKKCPVYLHPLESEWLSSPKLNGSLMWPDISPPLTTDPASMIWQKDKFCNSSDIPSGCTTHLGTLRAVSASYAGMIYSLEMYCLRWELGAPICLVAENVICSILFVASCTKWMMK